MTVADSGYVAACEIGTFNVVANDSDPEGDYPLSVVSVSGANFSVTSSTSVRYSNARASAGTKVGTYTVQDSKGAQATGTITITAAGGTCQ